MSQERHVADGESQFVVLNITPDFCRVGNSIVAFDICQTLSPEKVDYAHSVFARSEPVLLIDSIVNAVAGNAGSGVASQVSLGGGHSKIIAASRTVFVESRMTARHDDLVEMNGQVG